MHKVKNNLSPPVMKDLFNEIEKETRSGTSFSRPNMNSVKIGECSLRSFALSNVWIKMGVFMELC